MKILSEYEMYNYFKCFEHDTICMPASWRPSRGPGYELDEIRELAGKKYDDPLKIIMCERLTHKCVIDLNFCKRN